jgi:hypothetical protein
MNIEVFWGEGCGASVLLRLLPSADEGTTIFQNFVDYLPVNTV